MFYSLASFFYLHFRSRPLPIHRTAGQKQTTIILLYHFNLLTNIQTFICYFAPEMTTSFLVCVCLCPSSWMISSVYHESRNLYYRTVQPWHVEGMGQYDFAKFRCRWNFCYPPNWKENDIRRHALANEWIRYNTT